MLTEIGQYTRQAGKGPKTLLLMEAGERTKDNDAHEGGELGKKGPRTLMLMVGRKNQGYCCSWGGKNTDAHGGGGRPRTLLVMGRGKTMNLVGEKGPRSLMRMCVCGGGRVLLL